MSLGILSNHELKALFLWMKPWVVVPAHDIYSDGQPEAIEHLDSMTDHCNHLVIFVLTVNSNKQLLVFHNIETEYNPVLIQETSVLMFHILSNAFDEKSK